MGKQTKIEVTTVAPTSQVVNNESNINEKTQTQTSYVVVREGFRVSDKEYQDPNDPLAISEKEYWNHIAKNFSWGEPVEIVEYDYKKHRIW